MMPYELGRRVELVGNRIGMSMRQSEDIRIHLRKTTNAQQSLMYAGAKMYNELPGEIKNTTGIINFKKRVKEYILSKR